MNRKNLWIAVGIMVIILAVVGIYMSQNSLQDQTAKIGAILPLTGDLSSYGVDSRKALELAVEEANNAGVIGGRTLSLIVEDSRGAASQAVSAFNKLTDIDGVFGILGPITSAEVLSVSQLANSKRVPIISPSATSVDVTQAGEYVFRTINADNVETESFAHFVKDNLGISRVGIIALDAAGTRSYATSFRGFYEALGARIEIEELVSEGTSNYRSPIRKILDKKVEAIYVSGYSKEIGEIVRQIREVNKRISILSYQSAEDRRVVDIAGEAVDGLIFSSTTLPDSVLGKPRHEFVEKFNTRYQKEPGVFAAEIYDGINVLIQSLKESGVSRDRLIEALKKTASYPGASGQITFDQNGDVSKPIAVYKYKGKTIKPIFIWEKKSTL